MSTEPCCATEPLLAAACPCACHTRRGRGRPSIGRKVETRLAPELLAEVDRRAKAESVPRAEMLRTLIVRGLAARGIG